MPSLWSVFYKDCKTVTCNFCSEVEDLYYLDDEIWCRGCLEKEEYEPEPTYNELIAERNR